MPAPAPVPVPTTSAEPQVPKPSKGKKSQAAASLGPSTIADTQATSLSQQTMLGHPSHRGVGGGGEEREKKENAKRAPAAPSNKAVKLAAPRTAAVTVTITPETTERGRTYESVLKRARAYADPIHSPGHRVRKMRTFADVANVAAPVKSVTLEVIDLDDSVSTREVVAAIAAAGGCTGEAVHGRPIRTGRRGLGTTRVDCPVIAAKTVLNRTKGRLLIGFRSVVVRALEEQPLGCFKCFGIGHNQPMCPSSVERTLRQVGPHGGVL
uniref:SFRICE_015107 n=1 Tax=Spodoptera frugiperda TaxID=7108 RepID=A0A2H1WHU9_SPOFR